MIASAGKKASRRELMRKKAYYAVDHGLCARKTLTTSEIQPYFIAIKRHQRAVFGISKLSQIDLDQAYPAPAYMQTWTPRITLLQYALYLKSDEVAAALLRGGASPVGPYNADGTRSASGHDFQKLHKQLRSMRSGLRTQFMLWVLRAVLMLQKEAVDEKARRVAAVEANEGASAGLMRCVACGCTGYDASMANVPEPPAGIAADSTAAAAPAAPPASAPSPAPPLLLWPCCGHTECLHCAYASPSTGIVAQLSGSDCFKPDIACPGCGSLFADLGVVRRDPYYQELFARTLAAATESAGEPGPDEGSATDRVERKEQQPRVFITSLHELLQASDGDCEHRRRERREKIQQTYNVFAAKHAAAVAAGIDGKRGKKKGAVEAAGGTSGSTDSNGSGPTDAPISNRARARLHRAAITALPRYLMCTQRVGLTPTQRLTAWVYAVTNGDHCRVYSLLQSGVNLDASLSLSQAGDGADGWLDEYGHGAAFWCAMFRRFEVLLVLLHHGDDGFRATDPTGCGLIDVLWGALVGNGARAGEASTSGAVSTASVLGDIALVLSMVRRCVPAAEYSSFIRAHNANCIRRLRRWCRTVSGCACSSGGCCACCGGTDPRLLGAVCHSVDISAVEPYSLHQGGTTSNSANCGSDKGNGLLSRLSENWRAGAEMHGDSEPAVVGEDTLLLLAIDPSLVPTKVVMTKEHRVLIVDPRVAGLRRDDEEEGGEHGGGGEGGGDDDDDDDEGVTGGGNAGDGGAQEFDFSSSVDPKAGEVDEERVAEGAPKTGYTEWAEYTVAVVDEQEQREQQLGHGSAACKVPGVQMGERSWCSAIDSAHNNVALRRSLMVVQRALPLRPSLSGGSTATPPHPGSRGSFVIDNAFPPSFVSFLLDLHRSIPVTPASKASCSDRSYVFDGSGVIRGAIHNLLRNVCCDCGGWRDRNVETETSVTSLAAQAAQLSLTQKAQEQRLFDPCVCNSSSCGKKNFHAHARMRYLHYNDSGGDLAPHIDLCKSTLNAQTKRVHTSTHTFIIYLRSTEDCSGETIVLNSLAGGPCVSTAAAVQAATSTEEHGEGPADVAAAATGAAVSCYTGNRRILASISPVSNRLFVFPHNCPHAGLPVMDTPKILLRGELYSTALLG